MSTYMLHTRARAHARTHTHARTHARTHTHARNHALARIIMGETEKRPFDFCFRLEAADP